MEAKFKIALKSSKFYRKLKPGTNITIKTTRKNILHFFYNKTGSILNKESNFSSQ